MSGNVLIVEDHFEMAEILQEFLAVHNIQADIATEGKKALQAVKKKIYHCLVTDVLLPDVDGITVAKQIHAQNQRTVIVFITAKEINRDVIKQKLGFDCKVLQKPCKPTEILKCIKESL